MDFQAYDIMLIPVIVALVEVIGRMGVPKRFLPAVAIGLGLVGGIVYISPEDLPKAILVGVVMGLGAIGTYSGVKNSLE